MQRWVVFRIRVERIQAMLISAFVLPHLGTTGPSENWMAELFPTLNWSQWGQSDFSRIDQADWVYHGNRKPRIEFVGTIYRVLNSD